MPARSFDAPGAVGTTRRLALWVLATFAARAGAIEIVREPANAPAPPGAPARSAPRPAPPAKPAPAAERADTSSPEPPKPSITTASAPKFTVGDTWQFVYSRNLRRPGSTGTTFTETVESVAGGEIRLNSGVKLTPSLARLNVVVNGRETRRIRPHSLSLRFPLRVGKTWDDDYEMREVAPGSTYVGHVRATAKVERAEIADVPAGRFETLVVEHTWTYEDSRGNRETGRRTLWYAPEAGYPVRVDLETLDSKKGERVDSLYYELKRLSRAR